jgi:universal stress protein E
MRIFRRPVRASANFTPRAAVAITKQTDLKKGFAMTRDNRILIVVDPTTARQPAVDRGFRLARQLEAPVELFVCHYDARFAGNRLFAGAERARLRSDDLEHQLGYLRSLAAEHATEADVVALRVVWDTPLAEGIIRECLRSEPRMVIKDTHHHSAVERSLFTNTDWHLVRDCPVPLWLVKPGELTEETTILASVDPMHEHEKPGALDDAILEQASALASSMQGDLHVYHGYDATPAIARAGALAMTPTPIPVQELTHKVEVEHKEAFDALLADRGLAEDRCHLLAGSVFELLPKLARKLDASVVVMGSIARGRLQQAVVGSTAERVLEHLPCDLLIVKPDGFRSEVTYKAQAADFETLLEDHPT